MPIYEYTCKNCSSQFERLAKSMSAVQTVECPKCGSKQTSRTLSIFAVGSESAGKPTQSPGMCGRCGGPGPCGMD
jgi:putative FmdB family regulatory protein